MLTFEDCVEVGELTTEEVDAIAVHEHLPELVACEMGVALLRKPGGVQTIRRFIEEDIVVAQRHHNPVKVAYLRHVLDHFNATHPEA